MSCGGQLYELVPPAIDRTLAVTGEDLSIAELAANPCKMGMRKVTISRQSISSIDEDSIAVRKLDAPGFTTIDEISDRSRDTDMPLAAQMWPRYRAIMFVNRYAATIHVVAMARRFAEFRVLLTAQSNQHEDDRRVNRVFY